MQVKTAEGIKDVSILEVTPQNYITPDNEKGHYHCIIEVKKFDANTGKRLSVPRIQKFGKKSFEATVRKNLTKQGYDIVVLHDPNKWLNENKELEAKAKADAEKATAEAKAAADQAKEAKAKEERQKEINEAVANALKEANKVNEQNQQKAIDEAVAKALKAANKPTAEAKAKADETSK